MDRCSAPDCNNPEHPVREGASMHYGCELRHKGIGLSNAITPNRIANGKKVLTKHVADPAWERGVAGERRPDGSFMPLLTDTRSPMGVKERGERRSEIDQQLRRLKNDPNVFSSGRS